jgi:hypothetical protein
MAVVKKVTGLDRVMATVYGRAPAISQNKLSISFYNKRSCIACTSHKTDEPIGLALPFADVSTEI